MAHEEIAFDLLRVVLGPGGEILSTEATLDRDGLDRLPADGVGLRVWGGIGHRLAR